MFSPLEYNFFNAELFFLVFIQLITFTNFLNALCLVSLELEPYLKLT